MKVFQPYIVDIYGLAPNKSHRFEFEVGDEIFSHFGSAELSKGSLSATLSMEKTLSMIEVNISITGSVELVCDRSGDEFDYELGINHKVIFKFSDRNETLDDDVYLIEQNSSCLDFSQVIYDLILISIPMKKLHPRFESQQDDDVIIVFDSEQESQEIIDPRWEALKNLNQ